MINWERSGISVIEVISEKNPFILSFPQQNTRFSEFYWMKTPKSFSLKAFLLKACCGKLSGVIAWFEHPKSEVVRRITIFTLYNRQKMLCACFNYRKCHGIYGIYDSKILFVDMQSTSAFLKTRYLELIPVP